MRHAVTPTEQTNSWFRPYQDVNSFHNWGIAPEGLAAELIPQLLSPEGDIEAYVHCSLPWAGIMWHPEREAPFTERDKQLFNLYFQRYPMQTLILAAGQGTRLRPYTNDRPKCMVALAGKPLLHRQMAAMAACGVSNGITVIGGYRSGDLDTLGGDLVLNPEYATTNMVRTLFLRAREDEARRGSADQLRGYRL